MMHRADAAPPLAGSAEAGRRAMRRATKPGVAAALLLFTTPWGYINELIRALTRFFTTGAGHEWLTSASMFLIVGGLAILFLIASLLLLQSVVPTRPTSDAELASAKDDRQLRPLYGAAPLQAQSRWYRRRGRAQAREPMQPRIDSALDSVVHSGLGEPRLLRRRARFAVVRLVRCRGCEAAPTPPSTSPTVGCPFEANFLAEAFAATYKSIPRVRESVCRRWGQPSCDFEVHY